MYREKAPSMNLKPDLQTKNSLCLLVFVSPLNTMRNMGRPKKAASPTLSKTVIIKVGPSTSSHRNHETSAMQNLPSIRIRVHARMK
jgi:hypothetical protein